MRERAEARCEYCRLPERFTVLRFHVDHIIPVRRHGGSEAMENLAWACANCNSSKSSNIAAYDPITKQLTPLFHPRTQNWTAHFEIVEGFIMGSTPIGRITVELLQMNVLNRVETRRYLIDAGLW